MAKDRDSLRTFYDFSAEHWVHTRTSYPIESIFATVRLRARRSRDCGSRNITLVMAFKLLQNAEKPWRKIHGLKKLKLVVNNVRFQNGKQVADQPKAVVA